MAKNKQGDEYRWAEEVFRAHLGKRGQMLTSQRRAVLVAVMATHEHFSVEELYLLLKKKKKGISLASLYRTMPILVDCGIVRALRFGQEQRYEHSVGHTHHDHLVCLDCGRIIEVEERELDRLQERFSRGSDFLATGRSLVVRGYCRNCRRKGKKMLLSEMEGGDRGVITGLQGGHGMVGRLTAMGIRTGKKLTKVSGMFGGGPVVVQVEGTQVAVGRGMASRIEVELEE